MLFKPRALLFLVLLVCARLQAQILDPFQSALQVRTNMHLQKTLLTLQGAVDDSLGLPFSGSSEEAFRERLRDYLKTNSGDELQNSTLWVLGQRMGDEKRTEQRFQTILQEFGLASKNIHVHVLSVPQALLEEQGRSLARDVLEQTLYSFPSVRRDYQKPKLAEVVSELTVSSLIATPTFIFFFSTLEPAPAMMTVATHATLLVATSVYSKALLNWMLRKGFVTHRANEFQLFLKQIAMSLPFAFTFSVIPHAPEIQQFILNTPWVEIFQVSAQKTGHFFVDQSVVMVLQALFYSQVMIKGLGKWVASQKTPEDSLAARSLRPLFSLPLLTVDAFLFAMASSNWGGSLFRSEYLTFNTGHISLLALTVGMGIVLQKYSKVLNYFIPVYERVKKGWRGRNPSKTPEPIPLCRALLGIK